MNMNKTNPENCEKSNIYIFYKITAAKITLIFKKIASFNFFIL